MTRPWDNVECETVAYGAWDSGTRTIYKTAIPLWEESIRSGHPILGNQSDPRFTAYPVNLPETLPQGALDMGVDNGARVPIAWVDFGTNEDSAFAFCMGVAA